MADKTQDVAVRLRIVDFQGHPLTGTVDIEFEPQGGAGQTLEVKGANASGEIDVTGLSRISPAVYKITVTPTTVFAPAAQFVMIPPSGFKTVVFAAGTNGYYDHGHHDNPHGDVDHLDGVHADIHSDSVHTDEDHTDHSDDYWDLPHVDSPHEDQGHDDTHDDQFGDVHGDQGHNDSDHQDAAHDDLHNDYHYDLHGDHDDDHQDHSDNSSSFGGEHFDSLQPFLPPLTYTLMSQLQNLIATLYNKVPTSDPVMTPIINSRLVSLSASIQQLFGQTPGTPPQAQVHTAAPPAHTDAAPAHTDAAPAHTDSGKGH